LKAPPNLPEREELFNHKQNNKIMKKPKQQQRKNFQVIFFDAQKQLNFGMLFLLIYLSMITNNTLFSIFFTGKMYIL